MKWDWTRWPWTTGTHGGTTITQKIKVDRKRRYNGYTYFNTEGICRAKIASVIADWPEANITFKVKDVHYTPMLIVTVSAPAEIFELVYNDARKAMLLDGMEEMVP